MEVGGTPRFSVFLPTRDKPAELRLAVASLLDHAAQPEAVQVCFACDNDDYPTIDVAVELARPIDLVRMSEPKGYGRLHEYSNEMLELTAGGRYLMWNDDARMLTDGWDDVAAGYPADQILDPRMTMGIHPRGLFPMVPGEWVRAVGHWSLNAHTDSWWQQIGQWLNALTPVPIDIAHEPRPKQYGPSSTEFHTPRMIALRQADLATVKALLDD